MSYTVVYVDPTCFLGHGIRQSDLFHPKHGPNGRHIPDLPGLLGSACWQVAAASMEPKSTHLCQADIPRLRSALRQQDFVPRVGLVFDVWSMESFS